jgi:GTPase
MANRPKRSGFAALIGRPNVGKSTLLNRLTGEKLAIVSPKPQTTRNRILGIVTTPKGQVAFLDTPGIHQAKGELARRMVDTALNAAREVELVIFMIEAGTKLIKAEKKNEWVSEEDRGILGRLEKTQKPILLVINKIDACEKALLLPLIDAYQKEFPFLEVVPVSAKTGEGSELLLDVVLKHLPEGEAMFDENTFTDQAERVLVAEYVREQVLRNTRQEVPYSTAVVVEFFDESDREGEGKKKSANGLSGLVRIDASIFVERESQKAIIIGKRGQMLKKIGTDARKSIERLLGTHVYLSLRVRVEEGWTDRPDALKKMGYE